MRQKRGRYRYVAAGGDGHVTAGAHLRRPLELPARFKGKVTIKFTTVPVPLPPHPCGANIDKQQRLILIKCLCTEQTWATVWQIHWGRNDKYSLLFTEFVQ